MAYYEELNQIVTNVIGEKFLRNQNLCKLLYYYPEEESNSFDPISKPNIDDTNKLYMTNIFPMQKKPEASLEKCAYVTVVMSGGFEPEKNLGFRRINLLVDVIVHLDVWNIKNGYRPYKIMHEIDKMLNNQLTDLPINNRPYLRGFQPRDYSNYFYGFQLVYDLSINSNVTCDPTPQNLNINKEEELPELPKYDFMPKNLNLKRNQT